MIAKRYPTRREAERLLTEAECCNPGPWGNHSRNVALCAEKIASAAGLDAEKAYVLGLLHDIGRKFGRKHLGHVYDGYRYLMVLGYEDAAGICLTHSFQIPQLSGFVGKVDIAQEAVGEIEALLRAYTYDDYDRLIQLCDALGSAEGVCDIEIRMEDVKRRYGWYPQEKWDMNLELMRYFEGKTGRNIYEIVR